MDTAVRILLIEDEALIAMSVSDALETEGFEVETIGDASTAELALREGSKSISALVTDVRLGSGLTGWELARLARQRTPALPVVYVSGDNAVDHSAQGVPESIMIQKPFVPAQVVAALATLLNARPPEER